MIATSFASGSRNIMAASSSTDRGGRAAPAPLDLTLGDCARMTGGALVAGDPGATVNTYAIDNRTVSGGELFFAIIGPNNDGHRFLEPAAAAGARAAVVSRRPDPAPPGLALIEVPDTTRALQDLAAGVREMIVPLTVVGITGSCGKTSAREISAALLAAHGPVLSSAGNLNNHYGLPLTLLRLGPGHRRAVCELGISTPDEMPRLVEIARPEIGVVLNVNPVHLENFDSLDGIAAEKGKLIDGLGSGAVAVLNADDPLVSAMAPPAGCRSVTFGIEAPADVAAGDVDLLGLGGVDFTLRLEGAAAGRWHSPLPGRHNLANLLAGLAVVRAAGFDPRASRETVASLRPFDMRGTVARLSNGATIYDDSYNANPRAMAAVLEMLGRSETTGRRVAALGDMLELGPGADRAHREVGRLAAEAQFDLLVAVGELAGEMAAGAKDGGMDDDAVHTFGTAAAAGRFLDGRLGPGDLLLVKGSRGVGMEAVVRLVAGDRPEDERTD
jgi:UDP-N-acetylmuramoyl-tripeptide--D-alanyl-D-alanine ligase